MTHRQLRGFVSAFCVVLGTLGLGCGDLEEDDPGNGNENGTEPTFTVDVLRFGNTFYPTAQFECVSDHEPQKPSKNCPQGAGCDSYHWHGGPVGAIASQDDAPNIFDVSRADPDSCFCGHGKVGEVTRMTIEVLESDIINYEELNNIKKLSATAGPCPP